MRRPKRNLDLPIPSDAPLEELLLRHPEVWARVGAGLTAALATGRPEALVPFVQRLRSEAGVWRGRVAASGNNPKVVEAALPLVVAERMAVLAIQ
ncbi:MAG TPA: hypothetical protein VF400_00030, partial [Anaeromyxobacteraceae bacterium]